MKNNIGKTCFLSILFLSIIALSSCQSSNDGCGNDFNLPYYNYTVQYNPNRASENRDDLSITYEPIYADAYGGLSLFLWTGRERYVYSLIMETPQDVINVVVGNESTMDVNVILKIFYNYEESLFRVLGAESYFKEFQFWIYGGYEFNIPIQLTNNIEMSEAISKLTVGIFVAPEQYAMERDEIQRSLGLVLNYEIDYGVQTNLVLDVEAVEPYKLIEELMFHSLMINNDFKPQAGGALHPPSPWQVEAGQEIEMSFVTNPISLVWEPLTDYLIISMLDWGQVPMNGQPYLLVNSRADGQHGRFYITAPDEAGFYDFVAFIVPNPTARRSQNNFFPLDVALRFTLEVVDEK